MRVPVSGPVWAIACLFVATSLAGCHGLELTDGNATANTNSDGEDAGDAQVDASGQDDQTIQDDPGQETTPAPPPDEGDEAPPEFTFTLTGAPGQVTANETFNVTVQVGGDAGEASTAEVAYGTTSTSSTESDDLTADMFDATVAGEPTTLTLPGTYQIKDWSLGTPGTVYFRAHIVVDGTSFWSNEFSITVEEAPAPPAVEEVTGAPDQIVTIGLGGANADFSPATVTIAVGESVRWDNDDTLAPHTATHDMPEADRLWDTGNIAQGATSGVFQFNQVGTYAYVCLYHSGMTGSIVVE